MSIVDVILRYHPDWEPPDDYRQWNKCLCPFHGESVASAAVSYELDGFNCLACDVRGDAVSIIRHEEGVSYSEAFRIAEKLSVGGDQPVQRKSPRKPSRRIFGEPGDTRKDRVRAGVRGRTTPWT